MGNVTGQSSDVVIIQPSPQIRSLSSGKEGQVQRQLKEHERTLLLLCKWFFIIFDWQVQAKLSICNGGVSRVIEDKLIRNSRNARVRKNTNCFFCIDHRPQGRKQIGGTDMVGQAGIEREKALLEFLLYKL